MGSLLLESSVSLGDERQAGVPQVSFDLLRRVCALQNVFLDFSEMLGFSMESHQQPRVIRPVSENREGDPEKEPNQPPVNVCLGLPRCIFEVFDRFF